MYKLITLSLLIAILVSNISAQEKANIKFGKITSSDFNPKSALIDSNANAVVIADIGSSDFEGNSKGWFTLVFKRSVRIKILNKNGFDAATVKIYLYSNGDELEKLDDLKAVTYNLENGSIIQSKLEKDAIFQDRMSKNWRIKKFTLPSVKEGSVIEYSYTIKSDFLFNLQPWYFQGSYPCLWSEYRVDLPDLFNYVYTKQGNISFYSNTKEQKAKVYSVERTQDIIGTTERLIVNTPVLSTRWVMKDVPALKEEPFTSSITNYVAAIHFQLSQYRMPEQPVEDKMGNWNTVSEEFLKRQDFGVALNGDNSWLNNHITSIVNGAVSNTDKARNIYAFVRDNFTCTQEEGIFLSDGITLKDVFTKKAGSVADINLLLIAMLKQAGVNAQPLILSTRSHGAVHSTYPFVSKYNYLIAEIMLNENIYLDAKQPLLAFGKLSPECYNGVLQEISQTPATIPFSADLLKEKKNTAVFIVNDTDGMKGSYTSILGEYASWQARKKVQKEDKKNILKDCEYEFLSETKFENEAVDSLKNLDKPVGIKYDFNFKLNSNDVLYLTPMFGEMMKENPFKSAQRSYPVEMPYCTDETYTLNLEIPKGYEVDELPQSLKLLLQDNEGSFEYLISKTSTSIQMRTKLQINKTWFDASDYETLRDFYATIVKKESEQIVFKKLH